MPRAPFQILVLPYRKRADDHEFAVFSRARRDCWQGIAGGGEDQETPLESAKREAFEEAGIAHSSAFVMLQATCSIPVHFFQAEGCWDKTLFVVPEHSFGVDCTDQEIVLSHEHNKFEWLSYAEAHRALTYDSNRTALWELHQKLRGRDPRDEAA